jgi:hypothetical protein
MAHRNLILFCSAVALTAALMLGCVQSAVWNGSQAPWFPRIVVAALQPALLTEPSALSLPEPPPGYFHYGRLAIGVYALLLLACMGAKRFFTMGSRWILGCGLLAAGGDVIVYWLGAGIGPGLRHLGFLYLELPSLGAWAFLLTASGIRARRRRESGSLLALALPMSAAGTVLLRYLPHGILAGLSLTLLAAAWRGDHESLR